MYIIACIFFWFVIIVLILDYIFGLFLFLFEIF